MEYRTFQKTGEKISLLGFGAMRLPLLPGSEGKIDEAEAVRIIRHAIDSGVNYVDTAFMYHSGESEVVVGKALADGYREKVFLADKMPVWMAQDAGGIEALFEEQFRRLGTDKIDFYIVHGISRGVWKLAGKLGLMPFLEQKKAEGRIRHIGFSFHDELPFFKEVIDSYDWDFCQIQLNYMDAELQAGVAGLQYAGEKGIPVIVMEPLKGGKLTQKVPEEVQMLWDTAPVKRTPAEWAFRYVADFPEVLTILSGMSSFAQVEENLRILSDAKPGMLTQDEKARIEKAAAEYNKRIKASCTACRYCLPCPEKVMIPDVIEYYNQWHLYQAMDAIKRDYNMMIPPKNRASSCIDCKICEEKCPQHLPVSTIMKEMGALFE